MMDEPKIASLDNPEYVAALDDVLGAHAKELERPNRATRRAQAQAVRAFIRAHKALRAGTYGAKAAKRAKAKAARLARRRNRGT